MGGGDGSAECHALERDIAGALPGGHGEVSCSNANSGLKVRARVSWGSRRGGHWEPLRRATGGELRALERRRGAAGATRSTTRRAPTAPAPALFASSGATPSPSGSGDRRCAAQAPESGHPKVAHLGLKVRRACGKPPEPLGQGGEESGSAHLPERKEEPWRAQRNQAGAWLRRSAWERLRRSRSSGPDRSPLAAGADGEALRCPPSGLPVRP